MGHHAKLTYRFKRDTIDIMLTCHNRSFSLDTSVWIGGGIWLLFGCAGVSAFFLLRWFVRASWLSLETGREIVGFLIMLSVVWGSMGISVFGKLLEGYSSVVEVQKLSISATGLTRESYTDAVPIVKKHRAHFHLETMHQVELQPANQNFPVRVVCDTDTRPLLFVQELSEADRLRVVNTLTDVVRFSCHSVKVIIFGTPEFSLRDSTTILHNPDVTTLTTPFIRLERLVIYTASYEALSVERFITYAVNYLGRKHLKKYLTVHVCGERATLQANVWNTLSHLCKQISVQNDSFSLDESSDNSMGG
jgi:hypothetical protein